MWQWVEHLVHVVHVHRATWDTWGWSRWIQHPQKTPFWPLTLICSFSQSKVRILGCGSGWSTWYTWYTCTGTCGTPGDRLDGFSTLKNPHFDPSYIAVASKLWKLAFSVIGVRGWIGQMGPMVGPIVGGFKLKTFINKNVFIHQNKYFEGVWYF